jgi:hypothetical protein
MLLLGGPFPLMPFWRADHLLTGNLPVAGGGISASSALDFVNREASARGCPDHSTP